MFPIINNIIHSNRALGLHLKRAGGLASTQSPVIIFIYHDKTKDQSN